MSAAFRPPAMSLDWPLSRDEKKARALFCYDNEVRAAQELLRSADGAAQLEEAHAEELSQGRRAQQFLLQVTPTKTEGRLSGDGRLSIGSDGGRRSILSSPGPEKTPEDRAIKVKTSTASSEPCAEASGGPKGVDPEVWKKAIEAALSTIVSNGNVIQPAPSTPRDDDKRRTQSAPERKKDDSEGNKVSNRRYSRGSQKGEPYVPKVTFEDNTCPGDSTDDSDAGERSSSRVGVIASRRRLSRGPDGAPVRISAAAPDDADDEEKAIGTATATPVTSTAASAVAGGAGGFLVGGAAGAVAGVGGALFTFGLSIPIGAALGSGTGLFAGGALGGAVGYMSSSRTEQAQEPTRGRRSRRD